MNIRRNFVFGGIVLLFVIGVAVLMLPCFAVPKVDARFASHGNFCRDLSGLVKRFYAGQQQAAVVDPNSQFAMFAEAHAPYIFGKKPALWPSSKFDLQVYLMLPGKLHSDSPAIIAFTSPVQFSKKLYRWIVLLNGDELFSVPVDAETVWIMAGCQKKIESMPDLYVSFLVPKVAIRK